VTKRSWPARSSTLGVVGFYSLDDDTIANHTNTSLGQRQRRASVSTVPSLHPLETLAMLETIRDDGQVHEWAAPILDGEEIIPAGRANWLDLVWLSHQKELQCRVYTCIRGRSQP